MIQNSFKFIPGIGDKTEKMLWAASVFTWDDLSKGANKLKIGEDKRVRIEGNIPHASTLRHISNYWRQTSEI